MNRILFAHGHLLRFDRKQFAIGKPYPPLATITAAAYLRSLGHDVTLYDPTLDDDTRGFGAALEQAQPEVLVLYDDVFNWFTKMCLSRMREAALDMIQQARARGVRIRVIVPAINDSRIGRAASRSRWGKLLAADVEFFLYQPAMFHPKTMVVDGVLVVIGSANFDNRSFSINDEVTLNVLDPAVAADNLRIFADDLAKSKQLTRAEFEGKRPTECLPVVY